MTFRVEAGSWQIGMSDAVSTFAISAGEGLAGWDFVPATAEPAERAHVVVEILYLVSSIHPHALLAASFTPAPGSLLHLDVVRDASTEQVRATTEGPLARPLTVGLPPELAFAAVEGFAEQSTTNPLPSGRAEIVGGGFDVDSSPFVFRRCGALLSAVLAAAALGLDPLPPAERLVANWRAAT
jgi:hypothetical protein